MNLTKPSFARSLFVIAFVLAAHGAFNANAGNVKPPPSSVTFTEHIAPIVFNHCASCHRPGEIGPFPLLTYADTRKKGKLIQQVSERRTMPPWHPLAPRAGPR